MTPPADDHSFSKRPVAYWPERPEKRTDAVALISEEPLSIRIQGNPYVVIMRTPGMERAHAAGLCLAEGIVETPEEIAAIGLCDGDDTNVVTVTLNENARNRMAHLSDRREWVSQSSCGLCGKQLVEELQQDISPVARSTVLRAERVLHHIETLGDHQPVRSRTRASHAAALYDGHGQLLAVAEDVGRHNALDKAVGTLFMGSRLAQAELLVLSSRISYELVQKAARARIPIMAAVSRPTALGVQLADKLDICLCGLAPGGGLMIYTHPGRLR
jgi:FdhD protein